VNTPPPRALRAVEAESAWVLAGSSRDAQAQLATVALNVGHALRRLGRWERLRITDTLQVIAPELLLHLRALDVLALKIKEETQL
jgi:hypothetical protein